MDPVFPRVHLPPMLCFIVELVCHWLGPNLYVFPALELGYRNLGIGAVTIFVAGERTGEA